MLYTKEEFKDGLFKFEAAEGYTFFDSTNTHIGTMYIGSENSINKMTIRKLGNAKD